MIDDFHGISSTVEVSAGEESGFRLDRPGTDLGARLDDFSFYNSSFA